MQDFTPSRQRMLGVPEWSRHLAYHFFLSCRDLARVGLLVLRAGEWAGNRVVPAGWLAGSTSVQAELGPAAPMDYGYLWWIPRATRAEWAGAVLAVGKFGQYLLVLPALNVVIAHNRAVPDEFAIARNQSQDTAMAPVDGVPVRDFVRLADLVIAARRRQSPG
jgi:CubicO group peptidase (beta-lactamase class C family)